MEYRSPKKDILISSWSELTKPLLIEEIKKRNLKGYSKMNKDELVDMLETDDLLNTKLIRKDKDHLSQDIDIERLPKEEITEKIGVKL